VPPATTIARTVNDDTANGNRPTGRLIANSRYRGAIPELETPGGCRGSGENSAWRMGYDVRFYDASKAQIIRALGGKTTGQHQACW
jgi:hypothetical protein